VFKVKVIQYKFSNLSLIFPDLVLWAQPSHNNSPINTGTIPIILQTPGVAAEICETIKDGVY